jgi:hypothetical protein
MAAMNTHTHTMSQYTSKPCIAVWTKQQTLNANRSIIRGADVVVRTLLARDVIGGA